jgi:hypothetical protein
VQDAKYIPDLVKYQVRHRLRQGQRQEAFHDARGFVVWVERKPDADAQLSYRAAQMLARCADFADRDDREMLIEESIAILRKQQADGSFDTKTIARIALDTEFNGIRSHPKFFAFLEGLNKRRESAK